MTPKRRVLFLVLVASWVVYAAGSGTADDGGGKPASPTKPEKSEVTQVDLSNSSAAGEWLFDQPSGSRIERGELVLDGRKQMSRAFYQPGEWNDVTLRADFRVDPEKQGVLACGFVVRAGDTSNYYFVHFDRTQAILASSSDAQSWNEIKRVGELKRPAGGWITAELSAVGDMLRVSLGDKVVLEAKDAALRRGHIGFYANQGVAHIKNIRVAGTRLEPAGKLVIAPPDYVTVCDDAGAGAYEAFPDVCRLRDGRLMTVFYAGYGHVALPNDRLPRGGRIAYCTSSDEGRTWTAAKTLYDGPDDDRDPSIVQLKDGRLMCNFFSLRKDKTSRRGFSGIGTWIVTSPDLGKTWSKPRQISKTYYCSSPIRELSSGRLILGLYAADGNSACGAVIYSDDRGKTWSGEIDIDNSGERLDAETDLFERSDGTLYAAQRHSSAPSKATGKSTMFYATSSDQGKTWTASKPIGFAGHCPYFLKTRGGILLLAHRLPKTSLHYSTDEGRTWSANVPIDSANHGAYPSMVNLKDGSVLVVYYEEGRGSNIRARRFRATPDGIQWLPPDGAQ